MTVLVPASRSRSRAPDRKQASRRGESDPPDGAPRVARFGAEVTLKAVLVRSTNATSSCARRAANLSTKS